jgi:cytoskeletal protein CcmA (bactofilin family)
MWKKEDAKPQVVSEGSTSQLPAASPAVASPAVAAPSASAASSFSLPVSPRAAACISQGIRIKGEVTGNEDLFVDGLVEGKLNLTANCCLTVGPNGTVKADLNAREIIVRGKVEGKITARDKLQVWSTGQITGEVQTGRLAIEDGALLRGKVEAGKQSAKSPEIAATKQSASPVAELNSGTAAD